MSKVRDILKTYGPLDSESLAKKLLSAKIARSLPAARKQIQRSVQSKYIYSTYPVRINKSFLYYLETHSDKTYSQAIKKFIPSNHPFHRVLQMLLKNKGYITKGQIGKSSGCVPDDSDYTTGKRRILDFVIGNLCSIKMIEPVVGYNNIYKICNGFGITKIKLSSFIRLLVFEQSLLNDFVKWIQNVYIVGKNSYKLRSDFVGTINFNTTCWDFKAPVYLGPCTESNILYSKSKLLKAFAVVDIISFRQFSSVDAQALLERLKTVTLRWKRIRVFPIALGIGYEQEALNLLRSNGVVPLTIKEVWGRNVQELMRLYSAILSGKDESNYNSIETALNISNSLMDKGGLFGCIKGDLFEVMTALSFRSQGYDTTLQKKIISFEDAEEYEIDVVAVRSFQKCILIECKGRNLSIEENKKEIERHFINRCKVASESTGWNVTEQYDEVEAIYFTTSDESVIPSSYRTRNYHINCKVMARDEVIKHFDLSDKRLSNLVREYFFNKK